MFGNRFGIWVVAFHVVLQADQIVVGGSESEIWEAEKNGKCCNQKWKILVLKKTTKNIIEYIETLSLLKSRGTKDLFQIKRSFGRKKVI